MLTQENKENLATLAAYLERLPVNYQHFQMATYYSGLNEDEYIVCEEPMACGSVACAVGHGPAAGVCATSPSMGWNDYSALFTGELYGRIHGNREYNWCFSGRWSLIDNTHRGAAARIRYLLDHDGVPEDFESGSLPVPFDPPTEKERALLQIYEGYLTR